MLRSLMPLHPDPDAFIFQNPRGNPIEQRAFAHWVWQSALRSLGLKARRIYAPRHTYISKALTAGANEFAGVSTVPDI